MARLRPWIVVVLAAWACTVSLVAHAAIQIPIPAGWSESVPGQARARATAWAEGASLQRVLSPSSRDDFAETLAVIARPGPLTPGELDDDDAGLARLSDAVAQMLGITDAPVAFERVVGDPTLLLGQWTTEDSVVRVALVPTGPSHAAIVLEVERGADALYARVFDEVLADMTGATAPVLEFPRGRWVAIALVLWGLVAAAGIVVIARLSRPTPGPGPMGRNLGFGAIGLCLVVAIVAYVATSGREPELTLAGLSRAWLALQVAGGGVGVAALLVVVGRTLERTGGVIASAPSVGAYVSHARPNFGPQMPRPAGSPAAAPPSPVPAAERAASTPPPPPAAPSPVAPPPAPSDGFPPPGKGAVADLLLDEPSAKLEHVHEAVPEPTASLATAQITLDGRRGGGGRFGNE